MLYNNFVIGFDCGYKSYRQQFSAEMFMSHFVYELPAVGVAWSQTRTMIGLRLFCLTYKKNVENLENHERWPLFILVNLEKL